MNKTCSKCNITQLCEFFIKNRNLCKECSNAYSRTRYGSVNEVIETTDKFIKNRNVCK